MIPSKEEFFKGLAAKHGLELQKKFEAASVAVCGAGGLGSNIAIALARAGVGRLKIIDFDKIEITNLNRQQYFADQIGLFKALALKENLSKIAPYCEVTAEVAKITEENATELLKGIPIVCEAFDKAEAKAMLVNAVLENMPETYLVSGAGHFEGIVYHSYIITEDQARNIFFAKIILDKHVPQTNSVKMHRKKIINLRNCCFFL